jgi:hypothetical protein
MHVRPPNAAQATVFMSTVVAAMPKTASPIKEHALQAINIPIHANLVQERLADTVTVQPATVTTSWPVILKMSAAVHAMAI